MAICAVFIGDSVARQRNRRMSRITGFLPLTIAGLGLLAGIPFDLAAQKPREVSAGEAIENARDAYSVSDEQTVTLCPEDASEEEAQGADGNVIVVCRRLGPANPFQTRDGPRARMDRTADGAPRAPDISTIHSCGPGAGICVMGLGWVPPPVLMVDVTKFPEPLSPEDAALVFRAPADEEAPPRRVTGERVPIPLDDDDG